MSPPDTHRGSFSIRDASQNFPPKTSLSLPKKSLFGHELDRKAVTLATLAGTVGPATARLWTVYEQAKGEFFAVPDPFCAKKQATARFLRDTAENTLQYLQDKAVDPQLLEELETALNVANRSANAFHGGRKRKFEEPVLAEPVKWTLAARTTRNDPRNAESDGWMHERDSRAFQEPIRGEFAGHTRALVQHRRWEPPTNITQGRRNAVLELFPVEQGPKRKRKKQQPRTQPGRGHSNIPFGYSRPVDSYHPGV
jgi:hypothetical protein